MNPNLQQQQQAITPPPATNLYQYYQNQGQALPSVQQRQGLAQGAGINNYSGTADQNTALLAHLQNGSSGNANGALPNNTNTTGGIATQDPAQAQPQPATPAPAQAPQTPAATNPYLDQVQAASKLSDAEVNATQTLNNQQNSYRLGNQNIQDQTASMEAITGQQQSLSNRETLAEIPLQQKLALAQSQRQAALDAAKTGLEYSKWQAEQSKPIFGGYGTSGYQLNPQSGKYEPLPAASNPGGAASGTGFNAATGLKEGASATDILGYLSANGIDATRYSIPGLVSAIQNGATAQDIIQGRANIAGAKAEATVKSQKQFNPATGQYEYFTPTIGNGQGAKSGATGASTGGGNVAPAKAALTSPPGSVSGVSALSSGALNRLTTGDFRSGDKYSSQQNAIDAEIKKQFPNFNPQVAKANAKAISELTVQQADVTRGITAADDNFNLLVQTFKGVGVNDLNSPVANDVANKIKIGALGDSAAINFKSAVSTLQTEYATVLGRGGEVTDSVRKSASNVINGNYSISDLKSLHDYIDKEGKNVINSYSKTVSGLVSGGASPSSSEGDTGSKGGNNPLGI